MDINAQETYEIWHDGDRYEIVAKSPPLVATYTKCCFERTVSTHRWLWVAKFKVRLLRAREYYRIQELNRTRTRIDY